MKEKLIVKQDGNRLYIRQADLKKLKPMLNLAQIEVHKTELGKYTGRHRYYIDLYEGFKFLETVTSDYIITFT